MTTLPDCMMPDGADPCAGYQALAARVRELEAERDDCQKASEWVMDHRDALIAERDALRALLDMARREQCQCRTCRAIRAALAQGEKL